MIKGMMLILTTILTLSDFSQLVAQDANSVNRFRRLGEIKDWNIMPLKSDKTFVLLEFMKESGDCGFDAIGIPREEVYEKFLERYDPESWDKLTVQEKIDYSAALYAVLTEWSSKSEEFLKKTDSDYGLTTFDFLIDQITNENTNERATMYVPSKEAYSVIEEYADKHLKQNDGTYTTYMPSSLFNFVGLEYGIRIECFEDVYKASVKYGKTDSDKCVYLLHRKSFGLVNHWMRLIPTDELNNPEYIGKIKDLSEDNEEEYMYHDQFEY